MTVKIRRYEGPLKSEWDRFIRGSKNGVFLFCRDYMEYHAERFIDFSLMFYEDQHLIGVIPANLTGNRVISHAGLTFGGIVVNSRIRTTKMKEILNELRIYLLDQHIQCLIYKAIPYIYSDMPAQEDIYLLHHLGAVLFRRDISSSIDMRANTLGFSKGRKWLVSRAKKLGLSVRLVHDFKTFMAIEEDNLVRQHGVKPVHTAEEMELLGNKFPENIKLFAAYMGDKMVGGVIIYESAHVAHAQYIAASEDGRGMGATDIIISYLINDYYRGKRYFDFGISTEDEGRCLNVGLIENKESYGARAVVYDFYQWSLS